MKARIDRAKEKLKHFDYIVTNKAGVVEKCLCKCCGAVLWSLVPQDQMSWSEKKGDKTFIYMPVAMAPTNLYDVATLELDDGSRHQTPMCKNCLNDDFDLDAVYTADLKRLKDIGADTAKMELRVPKRKVR